MIGTVGAVGAARAVGAVGAVDDGSIASQVLPAPESSGSIVSRQRSTRAGLPATTAPPGTSYTFEFGVRMCKPDDSRDRYITHPGDHRSRTNRSTSANPTPWSALIRQRKSMRTKPPKEVTDLGLDLQNNHTRPNPAIASNGDGPAQQRTLTTPPAGLVR